MNTTRSLFALLLAGGLLAACSGSDPLPGPTATPVPTPLPSAPPTSRSTPKSQLSQSAFASCTALRSYYAEALAREYFTGYAYERNCFGCEPATLTPVAQPAEGDMAFSPAPTQTGREVSDTNTQEAGVDEADLVETNPDGTEIYVLNRASRELLVIETADPENLTVLSRTSLDGGRQPRGMFFDAANARLVIVLDQGFFYPLGAPALTDAVYLWPGPDFQAGSELRFFDVSDPSAPGEINRFVTDGHIIDARRIEDRVHLVTQFGFPYPAALFEDQEFQRWAYQDYPQAYFAEDADEMQRLEALIRQRIDAAVAALSAAELLPARSLDGAASQPLACERVLHPEVPSRMGLVVISSLDTDGTDLSELGSINNAWQLYASADNLYLMQSSGGWWFDPAQRQQTAIYRFDISSGSASTAPAVGLVDGWLASRFQLGEHEGHLRVASTEGQFVEANGRFAQRNHLSILRSSDMNEVAAIRDFVPEDIDPERGETIRSARFIGARGYVVTFEFTDPLFSFDLSDPANPQLAGLVEIPGFSSYIHPVDEDHLLTIGRAGGEGGQGTGPGFQLQLFDVSDLAAPTLLASASPALGDGDYAFSLAEYEPLAFTFSPAARLLSIPAQIGSPDPAHSFSGFMAYRVDASLGADAIREYARVDHKQAPSESDPGAGCPPPRDDGSVDCGSFAPVIYNEPLRSVIIRETLPLPRTTLLTLSDATLKALDASSTEPADLDSLELAP